MQLRLQELGEELIGLNESELASLALDDKLERAVRDASRIKSRGALRRQKQLIGKLMRDLDPTPIRAGLASLRADDVRMKRLFAVAEKWRDRLVADGEDALASFCAETAVDDTELRAMLGDLAVAHGEKAEKTLRRQIFRRVHEILVRIL
jgi:ribosome-associated protein